MAHGFYVSTEKAGLTAATTACSFIGLFVYASAAGTITVKDSGSTILGPIKLSALEFVNIVPSIPIACTAGLSATNSGGCDYTIFYGNK